MNTALNFQRKSGVYIKCNQEANTLRGDDFDPLKNKV